MHVPCLQAGMKCDWQRSGAYDHMQCCHIKMHMACLPAIGTNNKVGHVADIYLHDGGQIDEVQSAS